MKAAQIGLQYSNEQKEIMVKNLFPLVDEVLVAGVSGSIEKTVCGDLIDDVMYLCTADCICLQAA